MKQLPTVVLKGCLCFKVILYHLHVPNSFEGGTGSDINTSHIIPQGVQAVVTFVGGGAGDGGARA